MMLDEDDKQRAGRVMGGLLDRQQNLGSGDDPFALMKQMTDNMEQSSGPVNFSSYMPGGSNFKKPSLNSYATLARQKKNELELGGNSLSAIGNATTSGLQALRKPRDQQSFSQNQSPLGRMKEKRNISNPPTVTGFSVGGVNMSGAGSAQMKPLGDSNNIGAIIKNKEIFERAQKREQPVDWYSKLQESKEAFMRVDHGRLPILEGGDWRDPSGAFDQMISAKKEIKDLTAKKPVNSQFKLTKGQEIQIGLDMIPMFQAKEEELQQQHAKLKGLRQEIEGYMDEHGVKIRYAQPQHTTHFMNRKIAIPKKSISGVSTNNNEPASAERDVTSSITKENKKKDASPMNADLEIDRLESSAMFTGISGFEKSQSPTKRQQDISQTERRHQEKVVPNALSQRQNADRTKTQHSQNARTKHLNEVQPPPNKSATKWTSTCLKSIKGQPNNNNNQTTSQKLAARDLTQSQERNRTRSQSTNNNPIVNKDSYRKPQSVRSQIDPLRIEPIKSGAVQLRPLHVGHLYTQPPKTNTTIKNKKALKTAEDSGILEEERGESTCSDPPINALSSTGGLQSSMYPRLKDSGAGIETRNSMHIIETLGNQEKLEGSPELKMPPVSTAVAQRRKINKQESLGLTLNSTGGKKTSSSTGYNPPQVANITESQKRIRAILDKNQDHAINSAAVEIDAIGSYTVKQPHTHRDLKSLDEMVVNGGVSADQQANGNKLSTMQQKQIALEVTDRLYNKKKIKAMRKQTLQEMNNGTNNTSHTAHAKSGKSKTAKHERNLVSPKEKGVEYVSSSKDNNRLVSKDRQTIGANDKSITINSNHKGEGHQTKAQKRQQLSHNGTAMEKHREHGLKVAKMQTKELHSVSSQNAACPSNLNHHIHAKVKKQASLAIQKNQTQVIATKETSSKQRGHSNLSTHFADKVAKLKEIKTSHDVANTTQSDGELEIQPMSFRVNQQDAPLPLNEEKISKKHQQRRDKNMVDSNLLVNEAVNATIGPVDQRESTTKFYSSQGFSSVKEKIDKEPASLKKKGEPALVDKKDRSPKHLVENTKDVSADKLKKQRRSSSVNSAQKIFNSFQKETSKTNLIQANGTRQSRNFGHSATVGIVNNQENNYNFSSAAREHSAINTRKSSRLASRQRLTVDGELGSAAQHRSKNYSSRRDLKELIFVDQRAFATDIDRPAVLQSHDSKPSEPKVMKNKLTQQKSPTVQQIRDLAKKGRSANNSCIIDRTSNQSPQHQQPKAPKDINSSQQSPFAKVKHTSGGQDPVTRNYVSQQEQIFVQAFEQSSLQKVTQSRHQTQELSNKLGDGGTVWASQQSVQQAPAPIQTVDILEAKLESSAGARMQQSPNRKIKDRFPAAASNERTSMRKDTLKEIRRSITRARDEHRKNLNEISRINDSVKYSPHTSTVFDKDNLNQASIDDTADEGKKFDDYEDLNTKQRSPITSQQIAPQSTSAAEPSKVTVTQSVALEKMPQFPCPLEKVPFNLTMRDPANNHKKLMRVQSSERKDIIGSIGSSKIDMLQQNLQKLEKLERRLMRGRGQKEAAKNKQKSQRVVHNDADEKTVVFHNDNTVHHGHTSKSKGADTSTAARKSKKKGKNWRFAYDLYCKEIISSNGPQQTTTSQAHTQRSIERGSDATQTQAFTSKHNSHQQQKPQNLLQANQTTYPRHTPSNSMNRRDHQMILRQIQQNNTQGAQQAQVYLAQNNGNTTNTNYSHKRGDSAVRSNSSKMSSSHGGQGGGTVNNSVRRMIQTAGNEQFNSRHSKIGTRNSRNNTNGSRISTAGAGDTAKGRIHQLQFASQLPVNSQEQSIQEEIIETTKREESKKINYVEYPIAPTQPMLTDRSAFRATSNQPQGNAMGVPGLTSLSKAQETMNSSQLPNSLQQSPDRDDIILFAPMQTSPKNVEMFATQTHPHTLHSRLNSHDSNSYAVDTSHNQQQSMGKKHSQKSTAKAQFGANKRTSLNSTGRVSPQKQGSKLNISSKSNKQSSKNSKMQQRNSSQLVGRLDNNTTEAQLEATYCKNTNVNSLDTNMQQQHQQSQSNRRGNNVKLDKRFNRAANNAVTGPAANSEQRQQSRLDQHNSSI